MATPNTPAVPQPIAAQPVIDSAAEGINPASIHRLVAIVAAGAIGGFLFWILAKLTGTSPLPGSAGFWAIPCLMFLGAFAAAIGVYVLTASDTAAIKTYIFASLCGLCWQPIIASGVRMVANATATSQTAVLGSQVQAVQQAVAASDKQQVTNAVRQTVPAVTQALNTVSGTDVNKRSEVIDTSRQIITQLQSAADKAPEASVDALQSIAMSADSAGTPAVALQAIQALHAISRSSHNLVAVENALLSLTYIASHAKDPSTQAAAQLSGPQPGL